MVSGVAVSLYWRKVNVIEGVEENSSRSLLFRRASNRHGSEAVIPSLSMLRSSELFVTVGPNLNKQTTESGYVVLNRRILELAINESLFGLDGTLESMLTLV